MWPVPRKQLRGNWSSRIISASAPSGCSDQSSSSRRAAAKCSSRKPLAEVGVEGVVLLEPGFRAGLAPEVDDLCRSSRSSSHLLSFLGGRSVPSMSAVSSFIAWPGRLGGVSGVGIGWRCCPSSGRARPECRRRSAIPGARRRGGGRPRSPRRLRPGSTPSVSQRCAAEDQRGFERLADLDSRRRHLISAMAVPRS